MTILAQNILKIALYILLILIINIGLLFSRKITHEDQERTGIPMFEINENMRFFTSGGDGIGYINESISPHRLLDFHDKRQARPLLVIENWFFGNILMYISGPFHERMLKSNFFNRLGDCVIVPGDQKTAYTPDEKAVELPIFYLAWIISNILDLLVAILLFEQIWKKATSVSSSSLLFYLVLCFILTNFVAQVYFWAAHQQMCSILAPILCTYFCLSVLDATFESNIKIYPLCLLGGLLLLYYGNFLLLFPSILLPYIWKYRKEKKVSSLILFTLVSSFCFALPTLLWIIILKINGVAYYNNEMVKYRQFIWVYDLIAMRPIAAIKTVYYFTLNFIDTIHVLVPFCLWLVVIILLFSSNAIDTIRKNTSVHWVLAIIVLNILFFYFLGMYRPRLSFTIGCSLFCLTPFFIDSIKATRAKTILLLMAVTAWYAYTIMTYEIFL